MERCYSVSCWLFIVVGGRYFVSCSYCYNVNFVVYLTSLWICQGGQIIPIFECSTDHVDFTYHCLLVGALVCGEVFVEVLEGCCHSLNNDEGL